MIQRLRAVVTLGGSVDSSLGSLTDAFRGSTRAMGRSVSDLTRQQERLTRQIRQGALAGRDVRDLTREYERLGRRIRNAAEETERLDRLTQQSERANRRLISSFSNAGAATGGFGVAAAGIAGLMTMTNAETVDMDGMAKSYDMTLEQYKLWDQIGKKMGDGFDGTKIGDLIDELSLKSGELGTAGVMTKYEDSLISLDLDPASLESMDSYDRFLTIMNRLSEVKDKDKAAFAADEIFGGDGSRINMFLKNQESSLSDIMKKQKRLNLLTEEGRNGAVSYGKSLQTAGAVFGSAWEEIAGLIGSEVAPLIEKTSMEFAQWFSNDDNKKQVIADVKDFGLGLFEVGSTIIDIGKKVNTVAQFFGGWGNTIAIIGSAMAVGFVASVGSSIATIISLSRAIGATTAVTAAWNFVLALNPIGAVIVGVTALAAAAYLIYDNWGSISAWFTEQIDGIAEKWETFKNIFSFGGGEIKTDHKLSTDANSAPSFLAEQRINDAAPANRNNVTQNVGEIKVIAAVGQSPQEVAQAVHQKLSGQKFFDRAEAY